MVNEMKYKRWAWGALIGLAAVIVIAGIIMVMTLSSPKPTTKNEKVAEASTEVVSKEKNEKSTDETTTSEKTASNNTKTETKSEATKDTTSNTTSQEQSSSSKNGTMKIDESVKKEESIPKTGPEDYIVPIVALAICGYLFAFNAQLFKKSA